MLSATRDAYSLKAVASITETHSVYVWNSKTTRFMKTCPNFWKSRKKLRIANSIRYTDIDCKRHKNLQILGRLYRIRKVFKFNNIQLDGLSRSEQKNLIKHYNNLNNNFKLFNTNRARLRKKYLNGVHGKLMTQKDDLAQELIKKNVFKMSKKCGFIPLKEILLYAILIILEEREKHNNDTSLVTRCDINKITMIDLT